MKCPKCKGELLLKDEVTYIYSYKIDDRGKILWEDEDGYTSYFFVNREQKDFQQYAQCMDCLEKFDVHLQKNDNDEMVILRGAIKTLGEVSKHPFV